MATFKGIVEDSNGGQHHFTVEAENKTQAENLAISNVSEEIGDNLESFEVLVCMEMLTQDQVDDFLNSTKTIEELKKGDEFIFNDQIYVVKNEYRNDDRPLVTVCGQLFHNEQLPVKINKLNKTT